MSLLPALSKICERVALNQFTEYAIRRNCLSGHQSGNKKLHSTETLNILMSDLALEAMDRKQVTATPILKQLQWLPIVKQLEVRDATVVFKCLNGLAPPYRCQKFKTRSEVHNCNTRNRDRLHIPLCRTAAGQRAFTFRGQRLWNSLPDEFQSVTNLDVFKVKIKKPF